MIDVFYNIKCTYYELRKNDYDGWYMNVRDVFYTSSNLIDSMLRSRKYFMNLGGRFNVEYEYLESSKEVVSAIDCTSMCGKVRKFYIFDYSESSLIC